MMKKLLIVSLVLISLPCCQNKDEKRLKTTAELVRILSSDSLEGRYIGDSGYERSAEFVEKYLKSIGVEPFFDGSYRDTLTIFGYHSFNVVGIIQSRESENEFILLGAHLDHLGKMDSQTDSIFNGANDNASGVTTVLQIARELRKNKFDKKVIIALFSGEEYGMRGSKHLARELKEANIDLSYMINFEMTGAPLTSSPGNVYITGFSKSNFGEVANKILGEEFIISNGTEFSEGLFGASDNYPFYTEFKIPSHTISTFDFKNYKYFHSVSDEYSQLDIQHMDAVIQKTTELIIGLLQEDPEITLLN
jgi:Zn-dependent M28 family amino/carboxypeptidase